MEWLAQNGLTVLLFLGFLYMTFRGPLLGRIYGVEHLTVHELAARLQGKPAPLLLDVRTPGEFAQGHIAQARNAPLSDLRGEIEAIRSRAGEGGEVLVVCRSGARSLNGAVVLKRAGLARVCNVSGGMLQWTAQGFPVQR